MIELVDVVEDFQQVTKQDAGWTKKDEVTGDI
ncbi:hypothetical protein JU62_01795 [Listeria monocytogenes]|nr:hypothetical protein JU62_01795 [Listeria monocytogenes]ARJ91371.1 hypothetical protein ABY78_01730 [Listeria monocytogenes]EAL06149.1 conserved hypothetical protein [Listeria monocytogenes str. 1/2a F6854] [Listeria monocytogenes serotype 1/2a str. F6854]